MKKTLFAISTLCFLSACITFRSEYVVKENSENTLSAPSWIVPSNARKVDSSAEAAQHLYFVGEAQDKSQRQCLRNAETNAFRRIASGTAKKIMARFKKIKGVNAAFPGAAIKDTLEQNISVFVQNDILAGQYWERRDYLKEKGAASDYTAYKCNAVIKVGKTDLIAALEAYKMKTVKTLPDNDKKAMENAVDDYIKKLKR